jgi:hypothetical protein
MIGFIGLFDTARGYTLQFTIMHTHASIHSHVFSRRCSVVAFNGGRSSSSVFPNYPYVSATSFSQQQLTMTGPQEFSNWLTHQTTNWAQLTVLLIIYEHGSHRKHRSSFTVYVSLPRPLCTCLFGGRCLATQMFHLEWFNILRRWWKLYNCINLTDEYN